MRIAFCITELNAGGAERCLVELATRLDRSRFDPFVCCLGPRPRQDAASLVNRLEAAQVPVRFFDARGLLSAPRVFWQLRREMRSLKPDVVQTFLWHANVLGVLAASSASVPRIITGLRVAEPRRRWRWPIERFAGRLAERHVAVSEGVVRFAREKIGLRPEKIVVIPNGVDVPEAPVPPADLASLGVPPGRRAIVFIGRLDKQKGIDWLIEQAPRLFAELPNHDLLVVGTGPLESKVRRRAVELNVAERIHFTGWRNDVPAILSASDLLVSPSRWEGMSNVILEAMAAARPVVAVGVEGVADLLGEASPPQIVPRIDCSQFVARVAQLVENDRSRRWLGEQNRARAIGHFQLCQMIAQFTWLLGK